jgi:hypothetical protein
MRGAGFLAVLLLATWATCGADATLCPVKCGSRCLSASACPSVSACPADTPCDPCTGQCRPFCNVEFGCAGGGACCESGGARLCFDTRTDVMHCGSCDRACGHRTDRCDAGQCVCGGLGRPCAAGELCCAGACVPSDVSHCGRCDVACGPGETCGVGGCACGTASSPSGPACANDRCCGGVCRDLANDAANCGACGQTCPSGGCAMGLCTCPGDVDAGTAAPCPTNGTCCNGLCRVVDNDPSACGMCGVRCAVGETCMGGQCRCGNRVGSGQPACRSAGVIRPGCCNDTCFDLDHDVGACGACGVVCGPHETCRTGQCECVTLQHSGGPVCTGGTMCCVGMCRRVDTLTDCGDCNRMCDPGASDACVGGVCSCSLAMTVCMPGSHCTASGCTCDAAFCPSGCCDGNHVCHASAQNTCGRMGVACVDCDATTTTCQSNGTCN